MTTKNQEKISLNERTVFNARQTAEYTGMSISKIYSLMARQKIPFVRIDKSTRFLKADLDNWLSSLSSK
jgi:excisionase family DNA binding protein